MCGGVWSDAWLIKQLRRELARDGFDLACELAFLSGQLKHASGDRAQREHGPAEFWIASTVGSSCCEAFQQPCGCQWPQLAAQRLRGCNQQIAQLAQSGALGVDRSFPCSHKCLQRLPRPAGARRRRPLLGKHTAGSADSVGASGVLCMHDP